MEAYMERLVTEYHLDNAPISHTPLPTSVLKLEKRDPTDKADSGTVKQYQSLVAKLLYPTLSPFRVLLKTWFNYCYRTFILRTHI
jgi:hypothetical protein